LAIFFASLNEARIPASAVLAFGSCSRSFATLTLRAFNVGAAVFVTVFFATLSSSPRRPSAPPRRCRRVYWH
jgi:hypothetical protein